MNISVGVIFHNEEKNILGCLESLVRQSFGGAFEIILVNNLSTDQSEEVILEFFAKHPSLSWTLVQNKENGLASARNLVLRNAVYDYVYYTDADCILEPQTLQSLASAFEFSQDSRLAAVGGGNTPPNEASLLFQSLRCMQKSVFGNFKSAQMQTASTVRPVPHLPTCNLLFKKAILTSFLFDERFSYTGEDLDLSLRLSKAGFKMQHVPGADVIHRHNPSFKMWVRKAFKYGCGNGMMAHGNREILKTHRLLPLYLFVGGLTLLFVNPNLALLSVAAYALVLLAVSFILSLHARSIRLSLYLWIVLLATQISFMLGQFSGFCCLSVRGYHDIRLLVKNLLGA